MSVFDLERKRFVSEFLEGGGKWLAINVIMTVTRIFNIAKFAKCINRNRSKNGRNLFTSQLTWTKIEINLSL